MTSRSPQRQARELKHYRPEPEPERDCHTCLHGAKNGALCQRPNCHGRIDWEPMQQPQPSGRTE